MPVSTFVVSYARNLKELLSRNPTFRGTALRYLCTTLQHEDLTWDCPHITENVLLYLALHQNSFWTDFFNVLIDLIIKVPSELDQSHLLSLEEVITLTLSWMRNSPVKNAQYMFKLLYSPKWRTHNEAEDYKGFVHSLLRLLTTLGWYVADLVRFYPESADWSPGMSYAIHCHLLYGTRTSIGKKFWRMLTGTFCTDY